MFRMVANKLILNLMEKNRIDLYVDVPDCQQVTMFQIVIFSESFPLQRKAEGNSLFA